MDLTNTDTIKQILKDNNTKPNKRLGQNFLVNRKVLEKVVETADLKKTDYVLEVGSGVGCLTVELAKRSKEVFACEKDPLMTKILSSTVGEYKNVYIFKGDVLGGEFYFKFKDWLKKADNKYKIVSNLPYNITSFFLRTFLSHELAPQTITLMIQKEVALRIDAKPSEMSILAISVQAYAGIQIIEHVSKKDFLPVPAVDSAIIHLDLSRGFLKKNTSIDHKEFFSLVKIGFSSKRKTLYNNLSNGLKIPKDELKAILLKSELSEKARAQELLIDDWAMLYYQLFDKK